MLRSNYSNTTTGVVQCSASGLGVLDALDLLTLYHEMSKVKRDTRTFLPPWHCRQ